MKVALDATPLTLSSGGVQRYVSELSVALARNFPEDEYVLLSDQPFRMPPGAPPNLRSGSGPHGRWERRWWAWGLNRAIAREGAGVFHGTDFAVPYRKSAPAILTLHDLSPWMDRSWHHDAGRVRRRTPWLIRSNAASVVLTPSEAVRRQAIDHFGLSASRVVVSPLAASAHFRPVPVAPLIPYLLFVGTLEPRKNIFQLMEAWRAVRAAHEVELVLVGRRRADFPELPPEPGLRVVGEVPDSDLPALYSGALAFVYPSHYEGFGLPVLEAMQCGACVIASKDPALMEISGGAAVHVESCSELADAIRKAITCPAWVRQQKEKSLHRAGDFSWDRTARRTHEIYREILPG